MTLTVMEPSRWLAMSANRAVAVQQAATTSDMISPVCGMEVVEWLAKIRYILRNCYLCMAKD